MEQVSSNNFLYWVRRVHVILGIVVSLPVLSWSVSGLLLAVPPGVVNGRTYRAIEVELIKISPPEALKLLQAQAPDIEGVTAITLEQQGPDIRYSVFGKNGSFEVDAVTGQVTKSPPPSPYVNWVRQAHFFNFAGEYRTMLLVSLAALSCLSTLSGLCLLAYWSINRRFLRKTS